MSSSGPPENTSSSSNTGSDNSGHTSGKSENPAGVTEDERAIEDGKVPPGKGDGEGNLSGVFHDVMEGKPAEDLAAGGVGDGGSMTHQTDDYEELGPEYRPTPLPTHTAEGLSTLLEEDPPLGEGWDEFGNDVSAKVSQDIFNAARREHMKSLEAEAAAVRDGTHEEVVRRKAVLEEASQRRYRELQMAREHDLKAAEGVFQAKKEAIERTFSAAVNKSRDELLKEVEKQQHILQPKKKEKGVKGEGRSTSKGAQGATKRRKFLDDTLFGVEDMTTSACHRKYAKKGVYMMPVRHKLYKETILEDLEYLRDEDDTSLGRKHSRSGGVDDCDDGGAGASTTPVGRTRRDRAAKRACYGFLRDIIGGGGGDSGGGGGGGSGSGGGKRRIDDSGSDSDSDGDEGGEVWGNGKGGSWGGDDGGGGGDGGEGAGGRSSKRRRS